MKNYKEELKVYAKKLRVQIDSIDKILSMDFYDLIEENIREQLRKLRDKANELLKKLENNEFEIAIVGLEKAGKSTFANAMMGNNILPSRDTRCTYTSTCIRYGTEDVATVKFLSQKEFEKNFREKLQKLGIPRGETLSTNDLTLESYQQLFEKLDEEKKKSIFHQ